MAVLSSFNRFYQNAILRSYKTNAVDLGTSLSGTIILNLNDGSDFFGSFSGSTTFSVTNIQSNAVINLILYITDTSGSPSYTWPSGIRWVNNTEPSWTANGTDIISLTTYDGGSNWFGQPLGFGMA